MVGPVNTPHNGYSPRRRWPAGVKVSVSATGEFEAKGLSPCQYAVQITAANHAAKSQMVKLSPGEVKDLGTIRLACTDLEPYIGKPAPTAAKLTWEKDYASALKRASTRTSRCW